MDGSASLVLACFYPGFVKTLLQDTPLTQVRKARGYKKEVCRSPVDEQRKSVLDFCFLPQGASSLPVEEQWLQQHGYVQEHCGLSNIAHTRDSMRCFMMQSNPFITRAS